jgi:hypothetical protein
MLRHLKRGPARSAVERTVHQLAEQIATRREVGLAVMQYANAPSPRGLDRPRCVVEGGAVAYEGGAAFTPPGTNIERLLAKLERAVAEPEQPATAPTLLPSQADCHEVAPATATASPALPPGWSVERCDYKGNLTAYGCYWRALGPTGETEPTLYLDTACWEARRAAAAGAVRGSDE